MVAGVGGDGVGEEDVFFLGATADVMDDERGAIFGAAVGNDANVWPVTGQTPGDDVARLVAVTIF